jgi:DNA-binding transcriptional ArsR family regulator
VIEIEVDVADLARARFTTDAVWEAGASLAALVFPKNHLLHQRLRRLVPKQPEFDLEHLLTMVGNGAWLPDILAPTPSPRPAHPLQQIAALRDTDLAVLEADLAQLSTQAPSSRAARMGPEEYAEATVAALTGWWLGVLEPLWERVDAIQRADIGHHQAVLGAKGLAATMPVLHRDLSFDGRHLRVDLAETDAVTSAAGRGVWFVPSVFRWPWVACDIREGSAVVSYGARGSGRVWHHPGREAPHGLADLIGRTRASILQRLDVPLSTTALSRMLGLSLSTVSEHLSVMTSSGLLQSRRDGQRVLYWRTVVGDLLVDGEVAPARRSG